MSENNYNPEKLSEPLQADEIELKIATVSKGKGFSILLYKTARTDRNRLDEAFGCLNWKNEYHFNKHDNLECEILVWDRDKGQWVGKSDIGVENQNKKVSNDARVKGLYSDAFKRAGFRWGIGVELYKAPFIWINCNNWSDKGKPLQDNGRKLYINSWSIKLFDEEKGIEGGFVIRDSNNNAKWPKSGNSGSSGNKKKKTKDNTQQKKKKPAETKHKANPNFTKAQNKLIKKLAKSHVFDSDRKKWKNNYKLVEDKEQANAYVSDLKTELEDRKAAEKQEKEESKND